MHRIDAKLKELDAKLEGSQGAQKAEVEKDGILVGLKNCHIIGEYLGLRESSITSFLADLRYVQRFFYM